MNRYLLGSLPISLGALFFLGCTPPPICGDGVVDEELAEQCDDGNNIDGDGCQADCSLPQAFVNMDDVNNANANGAQFAVFSEVIEPIDADGDGEDDHDVTTLSIALTDQEDLCGALEKDPDLIDNLPDLQAVAILAFKLDNLGEGGFAVGDFQSNVGLFDILFGIANPGDVMVSAVVIIREGGVELVNSSGEALVNLGVGDGAISINALNANTDISGTFSVTLFGDIADPNTFDTDLDGDGINDFLSVDATVNATFNGATFCAALI